ncbi:uncharacterized protein LOC119242905 [Talpa occidentalis]|uniref:uncharacterized protein LOC119242905 n=1 Tax=Talpa occidentalis TaxID=50954 RepID=UPI00188ECF47|nr:uncharacterized protein LOC119242905 [Talpa occidentalis]
MEAMDCGQAVNAGAGLDPGSSGPSSLTHDQQAMLTVVVEVEQSRGSGPEETCHSVLLEGDQNMCLFQPGTLENQEAEQELLARVQSTLGSVGRGYSVALLLRGREGEAPRLVPQLLQMLFEEARPLSNSDPVLSTLSLVQLSPSGRTRDLLSPGAENLSVLDVTPLGLVVAGANEVEVPDSRAASDLYLQAAGGEGRDCPLLQVLAREVAGEELEGSLPWIVSWLLEGNSYSALLLRLDPQGNSLSLLQAALLGVAERRTQVKQVRPTLWNAVEEARARRNGLKSLRSGLLGDTLTDDGLSQLGRALRELKVVKAWSQRLESWTLKEVKAEAVGIPEPQLHFPLVAGRTASLGTEHYQKQRLTDSGEEAPDVALQFFLAQVRRQRLREQHHIWIQEQLQHLEQDKVTEDQVKDLLAGEELRGRQRQHWEQTVLRLQLEALQVERDTAEQDLVALYDLHVQAARARTRHVLQVFRAWRGLWEEQAMTREHHHRGLLACILQETIDLATQNQELQAQNQQLGRLQTRQGAVMPDPCSKDQEPFGDSFSSPHP